MSDKTKKAGYKQWILVAAVALLITGICYHLLNADTQARRQARPQNAPVVETKTAETSAVSPVIRATGTTAAPNRVKLRSQVAGAVVFVAEEFIPGKDIAAKTLLVRIDGRDAANAIARAKAAKQQAASALEIADGTKKVAAQEAKLLEDVLTEDDKRLASREPQYEAAVSALAAAKAQLSDAQLTFLRTRIRAPMRSTIISRNVAKGDVVSVGTELGELVGIDQWWVMVDIPISDLRFIKQGASARVRAPQSETWREAKVLSSVAATPQGTQMARVVIGVDHPTEASAHPALLLDSVVEIEIDGIPIKKAIAVDRAHLRKGDEVWVVDSERKLQIKQVTVTYRGRDSVYVTGGLSPQDEIVTSPLATPVEGMQLRVAGEDKRANSRGGRGKHQ